MQIIPAILTNSPEEALEKISQAEGLVQRVQIDIEDGVFANNKTIGLEALYNLETSLVLDIHLMTKDPTSWVEKSIRAGADRIIGQIEMMDDQFKFVAKVQEVGTKVGLAIDLDTQIEKIEKEVLADLDVILIMSVKAGFGGQEFQEQALEKVRKLVNIKKDNGYKYNICVDGGVEAENIKKIKEAGAQEVACGSSLFEGDLGMNLKRFEEALN